MSKNKIYKFEPVGLDIFDPKTQAQRGQSVVKVEVQGAPKNGTMGHCFIADAETNQFLGLVWVKSLVEVDINA